MKQLKFKNTISEFTLSKSERRILFPLFFLAIVQDWIKQAEERALTQFDVTAFYRNRPPSDLYKGANINNTEIPRYFEFLFIRRTNYRRSVQAQYPIEGNTFKCSQYYSPSNLNKMFSLLMHNPLYSLTVCYTYLYTLLTYHVFIYQVDLLVCNKIRS